MNEFRAGFCGKTAVRKFQLEGRKAPKANRLVSKPATGSMECASLLTAALQPHLLISP
jgi:hypothetical protein